MRGIVFFLFGYLMSFAGIGQTFETTLAAKLANYYQKNLPLKIQVTFNQPAYAAGDTIFFNLWLLTAENNQLLNNRTIVHLNFSDGNGKILMNQKLLVSQGTASNQFVLPASIAPGIYTVQAYCDWMKHEDRSLFYYSEILVSGSNITQRELESRSLKISPEGGKLIKDVSSKIIVSGNPMETGEIYDAQNRAITNITLDKDGFGVVYLSPAEGATYELRTKTRSIGLPEAIDGVSLRLSVPNRDFPVRVTATVGEHSNLRNQNHFLIISSHGTTYYAARLNFKEKPATLATISQNEFPEGIMRATIFSEDGKVEADRLFYSARPSFIQPQVVVTKQVYNTRERIDAAIRLSPVTHGAIRGKVSVRVYSKDIFSGKYDSSDFAKRVNFLSEVPSGDEGVASNVWHTSIGIDNFLITQSWKRWSWNDIMEEMKHGYFPDAYLRYSGVAMIGNEPAPDSTAIAFFLQNTIMSYKTYVTNHGRFSFPFLFYFDGEEEIIYRATLKGKSLPNVKVVFDSDTAGFSSCHNLVTLDRPDAYATFLSRNKIVNESFQAYTAAGDVTQLSPSKIVSFDEEIFGADETINFNDYKLFPTMEETLREIVKYVQHRYVKGKSTVRVFLMDENKYPSNGPIYIIDGVITDDTDYFMSLNPEQVETLKVVYSARKLETFGKIGEYGVIMVETKIPDNAKNVRRLSEPIKVQGLSAPLQFKGVKENGSLRVPEFRSCLYWNPNLEINTNERKISFFTPDNTGDFVIEVEGFTEDGTAISNSTEFSVQFSKQSP